MRALRSVVTAAVASAACVAALVAAPAAQQAGATTPGASPAAPTALCPQIPGRMWCLAERAPVSAPATRQNAHPGSMQAFAATPATDSPYTPSDLRAAYQVPSTTTITTVAVIDAFDAPNVESDLAAYRSNFQLPACTSANGCFTKVNQAGATSPLPAANSDWTGETTLDVEMVSAVCPTCHILLVEANDDDRSGQPNLETAIRTAVRLGAKYVSMSWGTGEYAQEASQDSTYLGAADVTYVAASGDGGYATSWPAVSPSVVSVGGTTLLRSTAPRGWTESVWSDGSGGGTGSGCSAYEPRPAWQSAAVITSVCAGRAMNDLSVIADPEPGVLVYQGGSWWRYGGTSAGTPMIAAMEAIAGTAGDAVSYPYTHAASFNDVTTGATASCGTVLCQADTGWDGPTGVGTPNGLTGLSANGALTGPVPTAPTSPTGSTGSPGSTGSSSSTRPNNPSHPKITVHNPGRVTTRVGRSIRLNVSASDRTAAAVSYRASGLPVGTRLSRAGYITGRPRAAGTYYVGVRATDADGASASARFTWRVKAHRIVPAVIPHVTGSARLGRTVTATWGRLRSDSRTGTVIHPIVRVRWYLDGRAVRGATHRTFTLAAHDLGKRITFRLTATKRYYARFACMSRRSAAVR